ncbi:TPA: hypothetical protein ACKOOM_003237 [Clostridioides difficile]
MEKKVINYFVDCIKKNKTRILIEKDNKYYISDGACVFIVDKNEMVLNPKLFRLLITSKDIRKFLNIKNKRKKVKL